MKIVASLLELKLKRNSYYLLSLLFILIPLIIGRCQALDERHVAVNISLPAIVFCIAIIIMCTCFWVCCCRMLFQRKQHYHRIRPHPALTAQHYSTYGPHTPSHYGTDMQSYPVQRSYIPPENIPPPAATVSRVQPRSLSPTEAAVAESSQSTVPQAYEPVSLPEATLHHGEAPPDYEEAIKMKPPDTIDQD